MYCKTCHYDLRGQETLRCPECGRAFDLDDPKSFLEHRGRMRRLRISFEKLRTPLAILLACLWVQWIILGPPRFYRVRDGIGRAPASVRQLHMITTQRRIWQLDDPAIVDFDRAAAVRDLPTALSAHSEQARIDRRKRLNAVRRWVLRCAVPTAVLALLLIPLVRGRKRWVALGVLALCGVLIPASIWASEIADALAPQDPSVKPSHAYLDDYVFIDGIVFTSYLDGSSTTISGYERRIFDGQGRRIVAFADGHVRPLAEDRARSLFEANGLEYPTEARADADD